EAGREDEARSQTALVKLTKQDCQAVEEKASQSLAQRQDLRNVNFPIVHSKIFYFPNELADIARSSGEDIADEIRNQSKALKKFFIETSTEGYNQGFNSFKINSIEYVGLRKVNPDFSNDDDSESMIEDYGTGQVSDFVITLYADNKNTTSFKEVFQKITETITRQMNEYIKSNDIKFVAVEDKIYERVLKMKNQKSTRNFLRSGDRDFIGVVWSLKWTERERGTEEKKEVLISTSSDGTVVQWTIRKGFESIVLIKVKRTSKKTKKDRSNTRKTENAVISQLSPATSFNFHPTDGNTYLVGTEEGLIHRCSCSYNEQTLDSYTGHKGQVYSVQWHPTIPNIFISCSEDWSIRLWHQRRYDEPIHSIQCSQKPIRAVQWSPHAPNVAASISAEAIDIWDLSISTLDPVFSLPVASGLFLTSIAFSQTSNSILVGDSEGSVAVYQLKGFKNAPAQDLIDFIQSVVGNKIMY
ncbi:unnamed protein product, partial [Oikopleura dioica]